MFVIVFIIALAILAMCALYLSRDYELLSLSQRFKTVDGTPLEHVVARATKGKIFFGNTFDTIGMNSEELFYYSRDFATDLKRSYIQYVLGCPVYNIIDANDAELVLGDNRLITKGDLYKFLHPFLKQGLLTSTDQHWHDRRKLLTPAFHFKILERFLETFNRESVKFISNLEKLTQNTTGPCEISLDELIPRFTLNTICETALGVQLDDCSDGDEYRKNITIAEHCFINRVINPLLTSDTLYNLFGDGQKDAATVKKLHTFSSNIIQKRRENFDEDTVRAALAEDASAVNAKQRYAMLDTMLLAEKDGLIDHAGICEEVDTFMFEGFDTTSMNLIFALAYLANNPQKQQRCYEELNEVINDDLTNVNSRTLGQLKYLECCIKETQRLCPSVPGIMRECAEDTKLANKLVLPKGSQIIVHIFDVHRNPQYFDNPNEFIPERFLPENSAQRHPYAFIPFSAGRRNCIGQKFAMAEIKTLLTYILKRFELLPVTDATSTRFLAGILIRATSQLSVKIVKRT